MRDEALAHLVRFLGRPFATYEERLGWKERAVIAGFSGKPWDGAVTLATAGLAELGPADPFRQELLVSVWDASLDDELLRFFADVAQVAIAQECALVRGEILDLKRSIRRGGKMRHLYVTQPTYFDESFWKVQVPGADLRIRWLVPLLPTEAEFAALNGPELFEDLLVEQDPDLLDLERQALRLQH